MLEKNKVWQWIDATIFPKHCISCNKRSYLNHYLCSECEAKLPWSKNACLSCGNPLLDNTLTTIKCGECILYPRPYSFTVSCFAYREPVNQYLNGLKFHGQLEHATGLGLLMSKKIQQTYLEHQRNFPSIIIPMPLHQRRLQRRGYNQALELAKPIAKTLNMKIFYNACYRPKNTQAQATLPAKSRQQNVENAFTSDLTGHQHVAIIDDIMTTGYTMNELCLTLQKRGVQMIDVWCCAKA